MDPKQETAASYYSRTRKRSFFYTRITVIASMFVLVIALIINIVALNTQGDSTTQSKAAGHENIQALLPTLPAGCYYQQTTKGLLVACPTPTPTGTASAPVNIALPQLPPQCTLTTSTNGSTITCTPSHPPIPTVAVTLPQTCVATNELNKVTCRNALGQMITAPLPSLPRGCSYQKVKDNYYVVCDVK